MNIELFFQTMAKILEEKYNVKIECTVTRKSDLPEEEQKSPNEQRIPEKGTL